ncbi:MAG: hypothetical protein B6I26_06420 [Desulfobacteraceae bacterium 4572_130]|nr:MAG: hypothetical protein B6I26_06420 [Desulfobacteraceae bacterium 4572_130]
MEMYVEQFKQSYEMIRHQQMVRDNIFKWYCTMLIAVYGYMGFICFDPKIEIKSIIILIISLVIVCIGFTVCEFFGRLYKIRNNYHKINCKLRLELIKNQKLWEFIQKYDYPELNKECEDENGKGYKDKNDKEDEDKNSYKKKSTTNTYKILVSITIFINICIGIVSMIFCWIKLAM